MEMGVYARRDHKPVIRHLIDPIAEFTREMVGPQPYAFADETRIYDRLFELKSAHFGEIADINLPRELASRYAD